MNNSIFKITFENLDNGESYHFFTNGIDDILEGEYFNRQLSDAKSYVTWSIKNKILESGVIDKDTKTEP